MKEGYSLFIQVLVGDVILRNFVSFDFPVVEVCGFDAGNHFGFVSVAFFQQVRHAFGIGTFDARQSGQVTRLIARTAAWPFGLEGIESDQLNLAAGRFSTRRVAA